MVPHGSRSARIVALAAAVLLVLPAPRAALAETVADLTMDADRSIARSYAPAAPSIQALSLSLVRVGTAHQHHCGPSALSTPGTECQGFAGREFLSDPSLFVVGYENNKDVDEKHVYQAVAAFDLSPLRGLPEGTTLSRAVLTYTEASTTRRSPAGDSEYGILPTCNTQLGVAAESLQVHDRPIALVRICSRRAETAPS